MAPLTRKNRVRLFSRRISYSSSRALSPHLTTAFRGARTVSPEAQAADSPIRRCVSDERRNSRVHCRIQRDHAGAPPGGYRRGRRFSASLRCWLNPVLHRGRAPLEDRHRRSRRYERSGTRSIAHRPRVTVSHQGRTPAQNHRCFPATSGRRRLGFGPSPAGPRRQRPFACNGCPRLPGGASSFDNPGQCGHGHNGFNRPPSAFQRRTER